MIQTLILSIALLASVACLCLAGLRAWRGWLDLRRFEIARAHSMPEAADAEPGLRIELADVRERLRKLEAIASGVEL